MYLSAERQDKNEGQDGAWLHFDFTLHLNYPFCLLSKSIGPFLESLDLDCGCTFHHLLVTSFISFHFISLPLHNPSFFYFHFHFACPPFPFISPTPILFSQFTYLNFFSRCWILFEIYRGDSRGPNIILFFFFLMTEDTNNHYLSVYTG